ncbi:hypothetical protein [uncultured Paraglaciecola sp.]|uniref:hypothetical protein n=1 Tax=uncultured Paraglaciecola sp. TaxID=1765024 RepID=UPI002608AEC4|nr:hypothetical protein [uncultured Paraglaciecola sp.]
MQKQVLTLTTADNIKRIALEGPHQVEIGGTFGSGTVTPYGYSEEIGKGAQLQLDGSAYSTTAADSLTASAAYSQWELTGSTGATVTMVFTPIKQAVIRA